VSRRKHRIPKKRGQPICGPPSLSKLYNHLKVIAALYRNKQEIRDALLKIVNYHLDALIAEKFSDVGVLLVIYGEVLFKRKKKDRINQYRINHLEKKLRSIGKLDVDRNLSILNQRWKEATVLLSRGEKFFNKVREGSFSCYYIRYHLNRVLVDKTIPDVDIVKSIVPMSLYLIDRQNLPQVILASLTVDFEKSFLSRLLGYCQGMGEIRTVMQCALAVGRWDAVDFLLRYNLELPKSIEEVMLTLLTAVGTDVPDRWQLITRIFDQFTPGDIFSYALERPSLFPIVVTCIVQGWILAKDIPIDQLTTISELAAARYDLSLLKKLFMHVSLEERARLFDRHVAPYLFPYSIVSTQVIRVPCSSRPTSKDEYGGDQEIYQRLFDEAVNVVLYFMEKGKFTFSLAVEAENPQLLGPRAAGNLLKWISYGAGNKCPHCFGTIHEQSPSVFEELSEEIERIYQDMSSLRFVRDDTFIVSKEDKVQICQDIARLCWLKSHERLYFRGSIEICGMIHRALLLKYGMKYAETIGMQLEEKALSFDNIEKFVDYYPRFFGVDDCSSLITKLCLPIPKNKEEVEQEEKWLEDVHNKVKQALGLPLKEEAPEFSGLKKGFLNRPKVL